MQVANAIVGASLMMFGAALAFRYRLSDRAFHSSRSLALVRTHASRPWHSSCMHKLFRRSRLSTTATPARPARRLDNTAQSSPRTLLLCLCVILLSVRIRSQRHRQLRRSRGGCRSPRSRPPPRQRRQGDAGGRQGDSDRGQGRHHGRRPRDQGDGKRRHRCCQRQILFCETARCRPVTAHH